MSDLDFIMRIIMKKYTPVYFDTNYVTYKLGTKPMEDTRRSEEEVKAIYYKNFKSIYPINDEILDRMAKFSEFPKGLLDKLSLYFPEADRELFYNKCEEMHQLRLSALQQQQNANNNM